LTAKNFLKNINQDEWIPCILEPDQFSKESRKNWARLIQKIYEVDPLTCPKCQGRVKILTFIEDEEVIKKILTHLGLWDIKAIFPPKATATPPDFHIDYSDSHVPPCDDYLFHDPKYPLEAYAS
jgi:hypothetical protein